MFQTTSILGCQHPVDQFLLRPKFAAAVKQQHPLGVLRKHQGLVGGGIAAAGHAHHFSAVQGAVAGGALGYTPAHELLFPGDSQQPKRGAGGDDDRLGSIVAGVRAHDAVIPLLRDARRFSHDELGASVHRLFLGHGGEIGPHDSFREAGEILDFLHVDDGRAAQHPLHDSGAQPVAAAYKPAVIPARPPPITRTS